MTPLETGLAAVGVVFVAVYLAYLAYGFYTLWHMDPDDERWQDVGEMMIDDGHRRF